MVVARIVEIAPHPDADKLRVCQVDDGSGALLQIVCGVQRGRRPDRAAGPRRRRAARRHEDRRGQDARVQSSGMLCSARELGLSQDHAGLMELSGDLAPRPVDPRRAGPGRHAVHAQAHAEPRRLSVDPGRGP